MLSRKFLLSLPIALLTWVGTTSAYNGTNLEATLIACSDDNACDSCTVETFVGHIHDTCEFNPCTALSGVTHSMTMERPRHYITLPNGVITDPYYGNVTCLMYATTGCTGTPISITIPQENPGFGCGFSSTDWLSFSCRFGNGCT